MPPRATPMSPTDRRAAIVSAVVPLVRDRGVLPSTREIADAAGIAEGTIYRVFADKHELLHAVVEEVLRPPDTGDELVELMRGLPDLRSRVLALAERSVARTQEVHAALAAMRPLMAEVSRGAPPGPPAFLVGFTEELVQRLTRAFEVSADELRVEPFVAATAFRALLMGAHSPGMPSPSPLTPSVITDLLLDGLGGTTCS